MRLVDKGHWLGSVCVYMYIFMYAHALFEVDLSFIRILHAVCSVENLPRFYNVMYIGIMQFKISTLLET